MVSPGCPFSVGGVSPGSFVVPFPKACPGTLESYPTGPLQWLFREPAGSVQVVFTAYLDEGPFQVVWVVLGGHCIPTIPITTSHMPIQVGKKRECPVTAFWSQRC